MSDEKRDTALTPVSEDEGRQTDTSLSSIANGNGGNGHVLKRKKPIAAWRLAIMFAWYVHILKVYWIKQ